MVNIINENNKIVGQRLVEFASQNVSKIKGRHSREIKNFFNNKWMLLPSTLMPEAPWASMNYAATII